MFFVNVASKRLNTRVSALESTVAGISVSVDSKGTYVAVKLCKDGPCSLCISVSSSHREAEGSYELRELWV